jgi:nicotinamide mononucleotide transporter
MNILLEIIAVVFSLISVLLSIKANKLTWSFGIIGVIAYFFIFCKLNMLAEVVLQCIFLIQMTYGLYMWNKPKEELPIKSLDDPFFFILLASLCSITLTLILIRLNCSKHPIIDATSTVFSLFANFFLANKIIQTWLYWMVVNVCLIVLFIWESMYPSAILYSLFFIMSIFGYFSWKKDLKTA